MEDNVRCSLCGYRNPLTDRFCGQCGAPLTTGEQLVVRREDSLAAAARSLPAKLGPVGKALAAGAVVLAAEAALAWLHRRGAHRIGPARPSSLPAARADAGSGAVGYLIAESFEEVSVRMRGDNRSGLFVQQVVRELRVREASGERRWQ